MSADVPAAEGYRIRQVTGHPSVTFTLDGVADALFIAADSLAVSSDRRLADRTVDTIRDAATALRDMQASVSLTVDQQPVATTAIEVERHGAEIVRHDDGRAVVVADGILSVLDDDGEVLAAYAPRAWYAVTRVTASEGGDA